MGNSHQKRGKIMEIEREKLYDIVHNAIELGKLRGTLDSSLEQVEHEYRADRDKNNIRAYLHDTLEHVYDTLDEFEETHDNATPLFDATVELIQALVRVGLADKD